MLRSDLETKKADLAKAKALLAKKRIRAPFAGLLSEKNISVGDYVTPGQILVSIVDPTQYWIRYQVSEQYLSQMKLGQHLQLHSDVAPRADIQWRSHLYST